MIKNGRFIEIDLIRGFAISLMVVFHLLWDLDYYGMSALNKDVYWYGQICPIIFFCIVGISLVLSAKKKTTEQIVLRGAIILLIGCILSLISRVVIPEKPITFGVLHCIGVSMMVGAFLVKIDKRKLLCLAIVCIALGPVIGHWRVAEPNIGQLAIGLHQEHLERFTVDYFPIFPWFGITILGMVLCGILYKDGKRQFPFPDLTRYIPAKVLSWVGRHSLHIYLAHQPVIAGTLLYVAPFISRISNFS